jgi:hypothetical protein
MKKILFKLKPEKIISQLTNLETDDISNVKFNKERIIYVVKAFFDSRFYNDKLNIPLYEDREKSESNTNPLDHMDKNSNSKDDHMLKESHSSSIIKKLKEEEDELYKKEISYRILYKSAYIFEVDENGISNFKINEKEPIGDNDIILEFNEIENIKPPEDNELLKNSYKKFLDVIKDFQDKIKIYIVNKKKYNNLKIFLYFSLSKGEKVKNNLFNINLIYKVNKKNKPKSFRDSNILNYDSIDKGEGFLYLVNEINE